MRPVRRSSSVMLMSAPHAHDGGRVELWRTPTPYLFLGFAVMMSLIAVALVVLICSRRKAGSYRAAASDGAAPAAAAVHVLVPLDREPKVVVIMAGDDAPSFLANAKPLAFPAAAAIGEETAGAHV